MSARDNPFAIIERMFDRMSRELEEAAESWQHEQPALGGMGRGTMGIDLADQGDEFVVTADVPGFEKDEIDLRLADNTLLISATSSQSTEAREETYLRSERQHRSMRERVRLPEPITEDDIEARLKNGVLTVHLPKAEPTEAGGRQIEIE